MAVSEVSFEVVEGEIFGLIGPNGAGKTTTMECVEGVRRPDRGVISILGLDPFRDVYRLQNRIGVQLQQAQLQKRIKVWEAVDLWASLYSKAVDGDRLLEQLGLANKRNAWFMTLSGGQKQRLFIALALINDPEVVFLDELTTGLDPQVAAGDLGAGARHPRPRQNGLYDHSSDGGGRAVVRPRGHHRARKDHRHRQSGGIGAAALPRPNSRAGHRQRAGRRMPARDPVECESGDAARTPGSRFKGSGDDFVTEVIQCLSENRIRVTDFRTDAAQSGGRFSETDRPFDSRLATIEEDNAMFADFGN